MGLDQDVGAPESPVPHATAYRNLQPGLFGLFEGKQSAMEIVCLVAAISKDNELFRVWHSWNVRDHDAKQC